MKGMEVNLEWETDGIGISTDEVVNIRDSDGRYPSKFEKYVGKFYFHPKTGHLYQVVGIVFQSQADKWQLAYMRVTTGGLKTGPVFTHYFDDFFQTTEVGGTERFMEVKR